MRRYLLGFVTVFFISSLSFALPRGEEKLLHCEVSSVSDFDQVLVSVHPQNPGQAKVYLLKKDQSVDLIYVSITEWVDQSLALPQQKNVSYRLTKNQRGWTIYETTVDSTSAFRVNCSE